MFDVPKMLSIASGASRLSEVTEKVRHDMNYKKDFTPETIRKFSEMLEHSCANNKACLMTALGDACKPKKISNTFHNWR